MKWFLLAATLVSFYVTLQSLGVIEQLKKNPLKFTKWIWGNSDKNTKSSYKEYLQSQMEMWAVLIPLSLTFVLARATYQAFFN
jgi:hypothetical protein